MELLSFNLLFLGVVVHIDEGRGEEKVGDGGQNIF